MFLGVILASMIVASHRKRFNVRSGRRFLGLPDFGHYDLGLFDKCFELWTQVYGSSMCSGWTPLNLLSDPPSAIGIGPLCGDLKLVPDGLYIPEGQYTKAIRFLAEQMQVRYPPTPVATPQEMKLYKKLAPAYLVRDGSAIDEIAMQKKWVQHVDCMLVFPKLPSHLSAHFKKWQRARNRDATLMAFEDDIVHLRSVLGLAPLLHFPAPKIAVPKLKLFEERTKAPSVLPVVRAAASAHNRATAPASGSPVVRAPSLHFPAPEIAVSRLKLFDERTKVPSVSPVVRAPASPLRPPASGNPKFNKACPSISASPCLPLPFPAFAPRQFSFASVQQWGLPNFSPVRRFFSQQDLGRTTHLGVGAHAVVRKRKRGRPVGSGNSGPRRRPQCKACGMESCTGAQRGQNRCDTPENLRGAYVPSRKRRR
jgi:hypothetical protein